MFDFIFILGLSILYYIAFLIISCILEDLCKLNGLDFDKYTIKSCLLRSFKSRSNKKWLI